LHFTGTLAPAEVWIADTWYQFWGTEDHLTYKHFQISTCGAGNGCYDDEGEFIILIDNLEAHDPSYSELVSLLRQDSTDMFPYRISWARWGKMYSGNPLDNINLDRVKAIIDGTQSPTPPQVCADFAERLHNNAELAGIRCGYVTLGGVDHACNAFQTTDRGLVFIDVTGSLRAHPARCVKIVNIQVGKEYIPVSLFPEPLWSPTWDSIGVVTSYSIHWSFSQVVTET
jgi:hypothetical protein